MRPLENNCDQTGASLKKQTKKKRRRVNSHTLITSSRCFLKAVTAVSFGALLYICFSNRKYTFTSAFANSVRHYVMLNPKQLQTGRPPSLSAQTGRPGTFGGGGKWLILERQNAGFDHDRPRWGGIMASQELHVEASDARPVLLSLQNNLMFLFIYVMRFAEAENQLELLQKNHGFVFSKKIKKHHCENGE